MIAKSVLFLIFAVATVAQRNHTANLLLPAKNAQNLYASVISSNANAAAYKVSCSFKSDVLSAAQLDKREDTSRTTTRPTAVTAKTTKKSGNGDDSFTECPFPTPITITQGASTLRFAYLLPEASQFVECKLVGTTQAICVGTATGRRAVNPGISTAVLEGVDLPTAIAVPITAGIEKLGNLTATSSKAVSKTASMNSSAVSTTSTSSATSSITEGPTTTTVPADSSGGSETSNAPASRTSEADRLALSLAGKLIALVMAACAALVLL